MWQIPQVRRNPPLKERVYHGAKSTSIHGARSAAIWASDSAYKQWDKASMVHALKAVIEDGMSIRRAAIRYGVPKSTLGDRVSGRILPGSVSGPPKLLTDSEEEELEFFLYNCAKIGYGKTRMAVMGLVNNFLHYRGVQKKFKQWLVVIFL